MSDTAILDILFLVGLPDDGRSMVMTTDGQKIELAGLQGASILTKQLPKALANRFRFNFFYLPISGPQKAGISVPKTQLIVNAICDPDICNNALNMAVHLTQDLKLPVLNHPKQVLLTRRGRVSSLLSDLPGWTIPKTIRITPKRASEVITAARDKGVEPPFIFRPAGGHGLTERMLIDTPESLNGIARFPLDGRGFYATQFIDFKNSDGVYRKFRFMVIDGVAYPRHMLIDHNWNVHAKARTEAMADTARYRDEERAFLKHGFEALRPGVETIAQRMGLDALVVDGGLDAQDKPVLFEANTCGRLIGSQARSPKPFAYLNTPVERIQNAIAQLLMKRAGGGDA
ncbi:MAG: hypothetical protein HQL54_14300 [Magnetococcales bacterium]|nr:hypothetical protein [Magnetococcales bacterium]